MSSNTSSLRYRFYRAHKYITYELYQFDMRLGKVDFTSDADIDRIKSDFEAIINLLEGHAAYEDEAIHDLLREKNSTIHEAVESEHQTHHQQFSHLKESLQLLLTNNNPTERIQLGHHFYLSFRLFLSDMLRHLYDEEIVILPELQRLYTDEELQALSFNTYSKMEVKHIVGMIQTLFPHMNADDHAFFLEEILECEPEKFKQAWPDIKNVLTTEQQERFGARL